MKFGRLLALVVLYGVLAWTEAVAEEVRVKVPEGGQVKIEERVTVSSNAKDTCGAKCTPCKPCPKVEEKSCPKSSDVPIKYRSRKYQDLSSVARELQSAIARQDDTAVARTIPALVGALVPFSPKSTYFAGFSAENGRYAISAGKSKAIYGEAIDIPLNSFGSWMLDNPQVDLMDVNVRVAYVSAPLKVLDKIPSGVSWRATAATPLPRHALLFKLDITDISYWNKKPGVGSCKKYRMYKEEIKDFITSAGPGRLLLLPKYFVCLDEAEHDVVVLKGSITKSGNNKEMKIALVEAVSQGGIFPGDKDYEDYSELAKTAIPVGDIRWGDEGVEEEVEDSDEEDDDEEPRRPKKQGFR